MMKKLLILSSILCIGVVASGCNQKEDIGDANKKVEPGTIKMPPPPPGGGVPGRQLPADTPGVPPPTEAKY